ncbi:MAG: hypothetical protein IJ465_07510 [Clostridia bacterium]|nr:hypothetical protein [Clostridia bacterium]
MPCDFDRDLIKVTEYEVLGKLPDPFLCKDGTVADTAEKWAVRRAEMYKDVIELQYGTQPPAPEFVGVELLFCGGGLIKMDSYRIHTGTRECPVSFNMQVFRPDSEGPWPVVVDGDGCFNYYCDNDFLRTFLDKGIAFCIFNRTELAHDVQGEARENAGQMYRTYPDYTFGALGAWAWGFSRCVDALEQIGGFDLSLLAFTGHSRGGKTAMLAGALDERATVVAPNETNAGSCGCYRIHMEAVQEDGGIQRSERLSDISRNYPFWFGPEFPNYAHCEQDLPFDSHFLKAMVAPRVLMVAEAASDIWTNPIGSWQTTMAAKEVFQMLGVEENLYWYFRRGFHAHKVEDVRRLVNVMCHIRDGEELEDTFFETPFQQPELIFDWRNPNA